MLANTRLFRAAARFSRPSVAILRYHSVQDEPEGFVNSIGIDIIHAKSIFEKQMEIIARQYNPVTLNEILLYLCGQKPLPRKAVAVTFDDGFADNFNIAAPILDRFGIRASFYITVNSVGVKNPPWFCCIRHAFGTTQMKAWKYSKDGCVHNLLNTEERNAAFLIACELCACKSGDAQDEVARSIEHALGVEPFAPRDSLMMNWDQIRKLHYTGHIIGSHTLTHPNLAYVGDGEVLWELIESKRKIEREFDEPIVHLAYPSPILEPHYTKRTMALSKQAGYRTGVTCTSGPVHTGSNPLALNRVWAPPLEDEFLWNLECALFGSFI